ncbi:hypothetical protein ACHHYP_04157 [Achlya hypogyna]|uniref:Maltase n=1 Tax=Achlya hypogyna TaxID=1202772 RepID=A0A0A7CM67_ACHHY|nr:secreted protein [Achlya hypogyna]OQR91984.1 hypothetical protein ACHHYP_04157 [Achlya hypogyna]
MQRALVAGLLLAVATADDTCARAPPKRIDCYPPTEHFPNVTQEACLAQGCCWDPAQDVPCAFGLLPSPAPAACDAVIPSSRMACRNPRYFLQASSAEMCTAMGCCYDATTAECFQPRVTGYILDNWHETSLGYSGTLRLPVHARGPFGNDIPELSLEVHTAAADQVRVLIRDPAFQRYEVPLNVSVPSAAAAAARMYDVRVTTAPFGLAVVRRATGETLFNSTPTATGNGLIFSNQFLELSTSTASNAQFFGLGERVGTFLQPADGDHFTIWARDQVANSLHAHTKIGSDNVYGVHPFYVRREASGHAHGVFLLNSNAMEVVAQRNSLTFRTVGGVFDWYIFLGPTPAAAVAQYTGLVGRPALPPYWALGYHLCRWQNLKNPNPNHTLADVNATLSKMRALGVPQDGQWTDINAMDRKRDFTWDPVGFPEAQVARFIDDLHAHGQHYVPIVDAGIASDDTTYASYTDGLAMNVFMKDPANVGVEQDKAWPGMVAFPDFFHPNGTEYWRKQLARYYEGAKYDGIWLDMNEPSSFCTEGGRGSGSCFPNDTYVAPSFVKSADVMAPFDPYRQPYVPGQKVHMTGNLAFKTAALGAHQYNSIHYNVHSLYGHSNIMATRATVDGITRKRTFILTRASYAGDGQYTAHWLGDNAATWTDMRQSIAGVLASNLFGIPMVGPDVCGFRANTTKELCVRWHQTAVLFPFMRNHNEAVRDQAPVDFDTEAVDIIRATLLKRYALLPTLYTQLYHAAVDGTTVARSLYFEFPNDAATVAIETQYLLGNAIMVAPVLEEHATTVNVYFPNATWFDLWTGAVVASARTTRTFPAPLDTVHMFIKGGTITPLQEAATTTAASRKNPFALKVALSSNTAQATGDLYLDSGDSIDPIRAEAFSLVTFRAYQDESTAIHIVANRVASGYTGPETRVPLTQIEIYGSRGLSNDIPLRVLGAPEATVTYNATTNVVTVKELALPVGNEFSLQIVPGTVMDVRSQGEDATEVSNGTWTYLVAAVAALLVGTGLMKCRQRRSGYERVK